jgi:hypothetical protein
MDERTRVNRAHATAGHHVGTVALMRAGARDPWALPLLHAAGRAVDSLRDERACFNCDAQSNVRCCEFGRDR